MRETIRKYGRIRSIIAITLSCIIVSVLITVSMMKIFLGMVHPIAVIISIVAPAMIGPFVFWFSLGLILKIDRAEEEQKSKADQAEKKYRILYENASDGIFIIQDERIKFPNPKTLELTGYSEDALCRIPFTDLVHPEDREIVHESYNRLIKEDKQLKAATFRIHHKTGRQLIIQINTTPILWEGRPAILNLVRDLTLIKRDEEKLIRSQKMEAIGTLASGIAHDFNNILTGIFGYLKLVSLNLDNKERAVHHLDQVEKGAKRATDLVQQILTFSRQSEDEKSVLRPDLIVKESVKFLRSSIPVNIKIVENITSRSKVKANGTQIHQIVLNLCTNAYHAMKKTGGEICINLSNVEIPDVKDKTDFRCSPGTYVKLEVKDNGTGIPTDLIDRIFEPYFTTREQGEGTGLGLSVVLGIVKNHNGEIKVSSSPGEGAVFQIYLPAYTI